MHCKSQFMLISVCPSKNTYKSAFLLWGGQSCNPNAHSRCNVERRPSTGLRPSTSLLFTCLVQGITRPSAPMSLMNNWGAGEKKCCPHSVTVGIFLSLCGKDYTDWMRQSWPSPRSDIISSPKLYLLQALQQNLLTFAEALLGTLVSQWKQVAETEDLLQNESLQDNMKCHKSFLSPNNMWINLCIAATAIHSSQLHW